MFADIPPFPKIAEVSESANDIQYPGNRIILLFWLWVELSFHVGLCTKANVVDLGQNYKIHMGLVEFASTVSVTPPWIPEGLVCSILTAYLVFCGVVTVLKLREKPQNWGQNLSWFRKTELWHSSPNPYNHLPLASHLPHINSGSLIPTNLISQKADISCLKSIFCLFCLKALH